MHNDNTNFPHIDKKNRTHKHTNTCTRIQTCLDYMLTEGKFIHKLWYIKEVWYIK